MDKSTCFISYCHSDINRTEFEYLVSLLKNNTKRTTEILYDQDIGIGKRFKNFMNLLDQVDLVLMICTPDYKIKAELGKEKGGGVGYEYSIIDNRYEQITKEKKETLTEFLSERNTNSFEVLPVILKGDFHNAIPNNFTDNNALDISYFKLASKRNSLGENGKSIPTTIKKKLEKDISKIVDTLNACHTQKQKSYEERVKETYDLLKIDALFRDTKADFGNSKFNMLHYEDTLFVRTNVYKHIETQSAYLLIGRKGSGKSAITQVLPIRSKNFATQYLSVIDIYANRDINFNILYSFLSKEFVSDTQHIFDRLKCFRYGWALFFRICIIEALIKHYTTIEKLEKVPHLNTFIKTLNQNKGNLESESKSPYFTYSFNSIQRFMNNCIENARKDEIYFLSDIEACFDLNTYLHFTLGKNVIEELDEILYYLPYKFLITFDGFDTEIERFREQGQYFEEDTLESKVKFEIDWLHSLLLLVNDIKQLKSGKEICDEKLDFCITIPNHRYLEILRNDIDSYRFQHRRKNLLWSGVELLLFVRKRLEVLSNFKCKKSKPWESFIEVMQEKFPYIPIDITFDFNGKDIKINIFNYVLRHTFWRPRDLLLYFAHIISVCKEAKDNGYHISFETIRTNIANLTFEIIKDDFKNEYKSSVRNIEQIIELFNRSNQVLTFEELENKIYKLDFEYVVVLDNDLRQDIIEKIKFLFQIGFLGIKANQELKEKFNLFSSHIFIFNEGCRLLKKVNKEKLKEYTFIIHPIFSEYLELNTRENEFISNYSIDYLHQQEGYLQACNDDFECV
ncbi:MAG TPA: hypothetical protein PLD02_12870 [Saprospiraceae bacterium]|nr:hypothetical protein [Saprospiraceae bacterium]